MMAFTTPMPSSPSEFLTGSKIIIARKQLQPHHHSTNLTVDIMPRSALNFFLAVLTIATSRWLLWHFFDLRIHDLELWSTLGLGVTSATIYQFLPPASKQWLSGCITQLLTTVRLSKFLFSFLIFQFTAGSFLSVIEVRHVTDIPTSIEIEDQQISINNQKDVGRNSSRKIGLSFSCLKVRCGLFSETRRFIPFKKGSIVIPYDALVTQSDQIKQIEKELLKSLFQFYESDYFLKAKELIAAASLTPGSKRSIERIAQIQQLLELSIIGPDPSRTGDMLLEHFQESFENDHWIPVLKACNLFSKGQYQAASDLLQHPNIHSSDIDFHASLCFFKGVCLVRAARESNDQLKEAQLSDAKDAFIASEDHFVTKGQLGLRRIGLPSSIIFQAILAFYSKNLTEAKNQFLRAAGKSSGTLKARALNGVGYVEFIEGRLAEAEIVLQEALDADPSSAYARSNYGYVLLARNQPKLAIDYFTANAKDEVLAKRSPRDSLLASLAVIHAKEVLGTSLNDIIDDYSSKMKNHGFQDFAGVYPKELRLAALYNEMAAKVYLGKDYYGLEPFALALLGKSQRLCETFPPDLKNDLRVQTLLSKVRAAAQVALANISEEWLTNNTQGDFFKDVSAFKK